MKTRVLFFVAVLLLLTPSAVFAMDTLVVATDYWPPFRIKGEEGLTGIDVDIMHQIGKRMGVRVEFHVEPWARCLLDMESGQVDLMTGLAKIPERQRYIAYASPSYYECAPAFYERTSRQGPPIRSYDDLKDVTIGFTRGSAYFEPFDSDTTLFKVSGTNENQLLKMLADNRLDVIIGTDCQVEYDLAQLDLMQSIRKTPYQPDKSVTLYIGISRQSPLLKRLGEVERIIEEMIRDGSIRTIAQKYTGTNSMPE